MVDFIWPTNSISCVIELATTILSFLGIAASFFIVFVALRVFLSKGIEYTDAILYIFTFLILISLPIITLWQYFGSEWLSLTILAPYAIIRYCRYIIINHKRNFNKRTFPIKRYWLGILLLLIYTIISFYMGYITISSIFGNIKPEEAYKTYYKLNGLCLLTFLFGYSLYMSSKGFKKNDLEDLFNKEDKFVLYVRSFSKDTKIFVWRSDISPSDYRKKETHEFGLLNRVAKLTLLNKLDSILNFNSVFNLASSPTFQQYFEEHMKDTVGELVGLGNPINNLPTQGLTSSYFRDDVWKDEFKRISNKASFIVTTPGDTQGLEFELGYILNNNLANRLFVFTPPEEKGIQKPGFGIMILIITKYLRKEDENIWPNFAKTMQKLGYNLSSEEPPWGSVIGFDNQGYPTILVSNAKRPSDYLTAFKLKNSAELDI